MSFGLLQVFYVKLRSVEDYQRDYYEIIKNIE